MVTATTVVFAAVLAASVMVQATAGRPTPQAGVPSQTTVRRLPPPDDARLDKQFLAFRNRLLEAAEKGDRAALRACMSRSVRTPDGSVTPDQLLDASGFQPGHRWSLLADALRAGVARSLGPGEFVAPYFAEAEIDFDEALILGAGVFLRSRPAATAPVVRQLSYEVVSVRNRQERRDGWSEVETFDGAAGFVVARLLKTPYEGRFRFAREDGQWKLVSYAVGD